MFIGQLLTFKNAVQICPHESCYHVSSDYNENSNMISIVALTGKARESNFPSTGPRGHVP